MCIGIGACRGATRRGDWTNVCVTARRRRKGGPEGPPLSDAMLSCGDYQVLLLQPFVPPLQVRVYVPGEVLDFVIVNTPVEFEVDESV